MAILHYLPNITEERLIEILASRDTAAFLTKSSSTRSAWLHVWTTLAWKKWKKVDSALGASKEYKQAL
eukprot:11162670-Lingulodinium_polyedra.AAC.1